MPVRQVFTCILNRQISGCFRRNLSQSTFTRFCHTFALPEAKQEEGAIPRKKLLKVAFLGRPNAGKSTLINQIINMNLCDVSCKSHTTRFPVRTAFVRNDTQVIFVDTPGHVTKKEIKRFELSKSFVGWKEKVFREVDAVGVIHEAFFVENLKKFHSILEDILNQVPESKPLFLIINKIDLVKDKDRLFEDTNALLNRMKSEDSRINAISKIFFVSALQNDGVEKIVDYLVDLAKESEWAFKPGVICDVPLNILIENLVRSKLMNYLPQEVPYLCKYTTEYLEQNELGEFVCITMVECKYPKHQRIILRKKRYLKLVSQSIESDMFKIMGKVLRLRICVVTKLKKNAPLVTSPAKKN